MPFEVFSINQHVVEAMRNAETLSDATSIFTKVWDGILDYFFDTHRAEAKALLFDIISSEKSGDNTPENEEKRLANF